MGWGGEEGLGGSEGEEREEGSYGGEEEHYDDGEGVGWDGGYSEEWHWLFGVWFGVYEMARSETSVQAIEPLPRSTKLR